MEIIVSGHCYDPVFVGQMDAISSEHIKFGIIEITVLDV